MCRSDKLKSSCFGLIFEFLLSMESMEPGQLSITLYSVCKIQNTKTQTPPLWMLDFFSTTYSVLSVRIMSVLIYYQLFSSFRFSKPAIAEDGFNHAYKHKRLMRILK